MYTQFYGFKEYPFKLTPDPDFLYLSPVHKKALLYLTYGLETKKGFIQLTGEVGSGKTTIIRSLLKNLHKEVKTAYIVNPKLTFDELFRTILSQFSIIASDSAESKDRLLDKFYQYLIGQAKNECPVVIILDEAQDIEPSVLEEIRLLSNLETDKEKLVQIIFVGQPELRHIFSRPELRQLKQRISLAVHIEPLTRTEIERYINHRLTVASANGSVVFEKRACDEIYQYSKGIPRLINIACDATLLAGYVKEKKVLDGATAKEAILELTTNDEKQATVHTGSQDVTACFSPEEAVRLRRIPSTKPATSIISKICKPRWKVALAISLLFASIAAGVTLTFWGQLTHQKLDHKTSVIKEVQSVMPDPKSEANPESSSGSEKKDGA
ncbi:MAG TPA: ExeA family protein [Candidatus Brocadiia bacterium]|nr:AAA family ATPase [Planctomycetota bacterium]MDO8092515.1 AAA family ATPase [Candidatus Brocadiales bacterium]